MDDVAAVKERCENNVEHLEHNDRAREALTRSLAEAFMRALNNAASAVNGHQIRKALNKMLQIILKTMLKTVLKTRPKALLKTMQKQAKVFF